MANENTFAELSKKIEIVSDVQFLPEQSSPKDRQFVFRYTITIQNHSSQAVQLTDRHWLIIDSEERIQEVQGVGVVGKQPIIEPGLSFQYTSGAVIESDAGTMSGSFRFRMPKSDQESNLADKSQPSNERLGNGSASFEKKVPAFALVAPQSLH